MKKIIGYKAIYDLIGKKKINLIKINHKYKDNKKFLEIVELAKSNKIDYEFNYEVEKIEAFIDEKEFPFSLLLKNLLEEERSLVLILDHIQDVGNFGSIIRTAEALGVKNIIIPNRNSVKVNDIVIKISAGAFAYINIIEVPNISEAILRLKEIGFWIYGTSVKANNSYQKIKYPSKIAIVMGNEDKGISKRVEDSCDFLLNISMYGHSNSLNVSVACGIILSYVSERE